MKRRIATIWRDIDGSVMVEAAFALPVLFGFGFTIIGVGRAMWIQNSMQAAVEAAARCAAIDSTNCGTTVKIQGVAEAVAGNAVPLAASEYVVNTAAACGTEVSASYTFDGGVAGLGDFLPELTAFACYPKK